jgi:hypothetical protein
VQGVGFEPQDAYAIKPPGFFGVGRLIGRKLKNFQAPYANICSNIE